MKKFNLSLIYSILISTASSSAVMSMRIGEWEAQKSTRQTKVSAVEKMSAATRQKADERAAVPSARKLKKTQEETKVEEKPAQPAVDFKTAYPSDWKDLEEDNYFAILNSEKNPSPQIVVDWSKGILEKLLCWEKKSSSKRIGIFTGTLSRSLCLLGKKANENDQVAQALRQYFDANPKFLKSWYAFASESLTGQKSQRYPFIDQDLINILSAHSQLRLIWPQEFGNAWTTVIKKKLEDKEFDAQQLVSILYEQAILDLPVDDEFQNLWCDAAYKSLVAQEFNHQQMAKIILGHALMKKQPSNLKFRDAFFKQIEYTVLDVLRTNKMNDKCLHSIYLGLQYFNKFDGLQKKTKTKYNKWLTNLKNSNTVKISSTQERVGNRLKGDDMLKPIIKKDATIYEEKWFDELGRSVDFFIQDYEEGVDLIIEVDGPDHFIGESKIYKPKKDLHDQILKNSKGNEKVIVHLPYYQLDNLKSTNTKEQAMMWNTYIRDMIRDAMGARVVG